MTHPTVPVAYPPLSPLMSTRHLLAYPHSCQPAHNIWVSRLCFHSGLCSPSDPSKRNQSRTQLNGLFPIGSPLIAVRIGQSARSSTASPRPALSCRSLNSRHPPRQRLILETTPHLHPAPTESRCHTYCRAIYPSHMSMPSLLPRRTI